MLSVIGDAELRSRMTKAGAENAERFSWARSADDLLAILAGMKPGKPYRR
jgi:glycosyltransferase involved in cell wall biosynthesis